MTCASLARLMKGCRTRRERESWVDTGLPGLRTASSVLTRLGKGERMAGIALARLIEGRVFGMPEVAACVAVAWIPAYLPQGARIVLRHMSDEKERTMWSLADCRRTVMPRQEHAARPEMLRMPLERAESVRASMRPYMGSSGQKLGAAA